MFNLYLWIKAIHIIAVVFWMAGLLYMPRLFVYHSSSVKGGELETKMIESAEKLQRIIMTPAMICAVLMGLILVVYNAASLTTTFWLPLKLIFVFSLVGFHGYLTATRKKFAHGERPKSEKFFRMINEIPSILTIFIVLLVVLKPF
ncbi:MAG: protoporphyrinogen oxidase HemJ [Litorimonas sp.]